MDLSREAKLVAGLTLLTVPTIMFGGVKLLGVGAACLVVAVLLTGVGLLRRPKGAARQGV